MAELNFKLFENRDLVPQGWLARSQQQDFGDFRVFNPTITAIGDGYAMCYRVVQAGQDMRWLATCKLDRDFAIVPGSVTPLSEYLDFAKRDSLDQRALSWHADPRYFMLKGRLYLAWNDGGNKPVNHQFLIEMDQDGLRPIGKARVMSCTPRRQIEKNWMLFELDGEVYGVYLIAPLSMLKFDLDQPDQLDGKEVSLTGWSPAYSEFYGVLRGSAQPIRMGERFLTLAHSSFNTHVGRMYCAAFYSFSATLPFTVEAATVQPFELPNPKGSQFDFPQLNEEVFEVVYPCGMVANAGDLIISYGINDEYCAIAAVALADVEKLMEPVANEFSITITKRDTPVKPGPVPAESDYRSVIEAQPVPLVWWDCVGKKFDGSIGKRMFQTGNFGDIASREVVEALLRQPTQPASGARRRLISVGSVIHTAKNGDIVWGSGMKGTKMLLDSSVKDLRVHAVRGPLTLDMVRRHGIDISKVNHLFDPGCLLPHLFPDHIARARAAQTDTSFKIIPHFRDDMILRRQYYRLRQHFVSVDCTPLQMIDAIMGAERVVSSSLHGIIFAESLGIPACWLAPVGGEDHLKYYDYYFGTGRFVVKRFETLEDALRAEPMPLPKFDFQSYADTFPMDEVKQLGETGLEVDRNVSFANFEESPIWPFFSTLGMDFISSDGPWGTAKHSRISTNVLAPEGTELVARVSVRPFNHVDYQRPQAVAASVNGSPSVEVEWSRGATNEVKIDIPFTAHARQTPVEIMFQARNCRSPKSLGIPVIESPISFCLMGLQFQRADSA